MMVRHSKVFIRNRIELDIVDSTNKYALDLDKEGQLVIARAQRAGRGRKGRPWYSPEGNNIYMTVTLGKSDPKYPLIAGVSLRQTLAMLMQDRDVLIKWPNDILLEGKKVAGILCESRGKITAIGMGVNVNQDVWPDELKDKATSLALISGVQYNIGQLIDTIVESLARWISIYIRDGFAPVRRYFLQHAVAIGKSAFTEDGTPCTILDLTMEGHLVLNIQGKVVTLSSGEIFMASQTA
ncbi:MAG: biotin--[acetyl-CoA-carboxylase] ligase [Deltaproteobacteria bacterium]|nr:biotin--[acetyl-CoA-carboxylase] ligase [Deltaproteobacteria bacterium]